MNIAFILSIVAVIYAVEEHPFTSYHDMYCSYCLYIMSLIIMIALHDCVLLD